MIITPDDITTIATELVAFELLGEAPFNFQRRAPGDPEVHQLAADIVRFPSHLMEEQRRKRAITMAHHIADRLVQRGWIAGGRQNDVNYQTRSGIV